MSTKNLSRTVIEGGRYKGNKWDRYQSHAEERAQVKNYLRDVIQDLENYEEYDPEGQRHVYKGFRDKLNPMYRWIEAQVGRPWSEVRSEIFQKFDTRTTAGRHITFDHLLSSIVETDSGFDERGCIVNPDIETLEARKYHYGRRHEYYVNEAGILSKPDENYREWRRNRSRRFTKESYLKVEEWLGNRIISEKGGRLYWHLPSEGTWKASWIDPNKGFETYSLPKLKYYLLDNDLHDVWVKSSFYPYGFYGSGKVHGDYWKEMEFPFSFRQRGELSKEDAKIFRELHPSFQKEILAYSKGR
jgi:hypothetical protein